MGEPRATPHRAFTTTCRPHCGKPVTSFWEWLFFPVLAFAGIPPMHVFASGSINLVYQYWIHTETIDRLPKPVEFVLNTPSHHRVHHGSNRQ